jgi:O-antigen ligase
VPGASRTDRSVIDLAIEACWLAALALVPIAFSGRDIVALFLQPKDFVLHLFALLIVALWSIEWAFGSFRSRVRLHSPLAIGWRLSTDPQRWALTSAACLGLVVVISTILSPIPAVSLWGRNFSELGYDLYSVLSFLVLFFAIAIRIRTEDQIRRILWVVAGVGVLTGAYGVSQRFGWDPIGNGAGASRVVSSFGNPIFFGSYLVMSTVVTLGVALDGARKKNRWWPVVIALALGIQFAAIWLTGSRGPWLGLLFGLITFGVLGSLKLERKSLAMVVSVVVSGLLLAVIVVNAAGDGNTGKERGVGSVVTGLAPTGDGLNGRGDIWRGSVRLMGSWEVQQAENKVRSLFRPVFGLGPEMYFYSYPLAANPQYTHPVLGEVLVSHAHNLPLQLLFEYGLLGLLSFVVMAVSILAAGMIVIWRKSDYGDQDAPEQNWLVIAALAVVAALIGRSIEQTTGVARVGDLVPFWILAGVIVAIFGVQQERPSGINPIALGRARIIPVIAAGVVSITVLGIFMVRDVQMDVASWSNFL